ncbi:hypothetical protein AB1484_28170 [Parafrankia sp. FMc6]
MAEPADPQSFAKPLTGHTNAVLSVTFSANGKILVSARADHTARLSGR